MILARLTRAFPLMLLACLLSQCNTLKSDCSAIAEREAQIAQEPNGDYFIGRRYYIPSTRFWGYLRRPGESWRQAKMVVMDERYAPTPDRGLEPPSQGATFGTDANYEYIIKGSYSTEEKKVCYEPNSNQLLPIFIATSYQLRNAEPGFLFCPSEEYSKTVLTLFPKIMPRPEDCALLDSSRQFDLNKE